MEPYIGAYPHNHQASPATLSSYEREAAMHRTQAASRSLQAQLGHDLDAQLAEDIEAQSGQEVEARLDHDMQSQHYQAQLDHAMRVQAARNLQAQIAHHIGTQVALDIQAQVAREIQTQIAQVAPLNFPPRGLIPGNARRSSFQPLQRGLAPRGLYTAPSLGSPITDLTENIIGLLNLPARHDGSTPPPLRSPYPLGNNHPLPSTNPYQTAAPGLDQVGDEYSQPTEQSCRRPDSSCYSVVQLGTGHRIGRDNCIPALALPAPVQPVPEQWNRGPILVSKVDDNVEGGTSLSPSLHYGSRLGAPPSDPADPPSQRVSSKRLSSSRSVDTEEEWHREQKRARMIPPGLVNRDLLRPLHEVVEDRPPEPEYRPRYMSPLLLTKDKLPLLGRYQHGERAAEWLAQQERAQPLPPTQERFPYTRLTAPCWEYADPEEQPVSDDSDAKSTTALYYGEEHTVYSDDDDEDEDEDEDDGYLDDSDEEEQTVHHDEEDADGVTDDEAEFVSASQNFH